MAVQDLVKRTRIHMAVLQQYEPKASIRATAKDKPPMVTTGDAVV